MFEILFSGIPSFLSLTAGTLSFATAAITSLLIHNKKSKSKSKKRKNQSDTTKSNSMDFSITNRRIDIPLIRHSVFAFEDSSKCQRANIVEKSNQSIQELYELQTELKKIEQGSLTPDDLKKLITDFDIFIANYAELHKTLSAYPSNLPNISHSDNVPESVSKSTK